MGNSRYNTTKPTPRKYGKKTQKGGRDRRNSEGNHKRDKQKKTRKKAVLSKRSNRAEDEEIWTWDIRGARGNRESFQCVLGQDRLEK